MVFRSLVELRGEDHHESHFGWMMLFLGLFGILVGIIVMLLGFRLKLVGY